MSQQTKTSIVGIRTVGVPVTDQDRAIQFYVGTLGFEKRLDVPMPQLGGRWIEVAPPESATTIALIPASDRAPAGREVGARFIARDATALHAELRERGVDVDELLLWEGVPPMFAFRDQDGNGLEIVE